MSTGTAAMKIPLKPPTMNRVTKATQLSMTVSNVTWPPQMVPIQLNTFMADGNAIIIVETMKVMPRAGFMPLPPYRMDYSPITDRPIIKWPNNARIAFWVAPNIEHYEYMPPPDGVRNPWPRVPHPDVQQYSSLEFGNRVGFWRVLEVLDRYGIRCSTTLSIGVL